MQCQSYLPVYHSHFDLNVDTSGGSRATYNGNGNFRSGLCNNNVSTLPVPQANFGYKEVLCQTMLMQEVTFRDQVQELHRLYSRHRNLMFEIKSKETPTSSLHVEVQSSNSSSGKLSSSFRQVSDGVQRGSDCIKESKTPDSPVAFQHGGSLHKIPASKGKKIGGRLLDLELPAEVYIDSDEWESLREAHEGPTPASLSSSKRCKFLDTGGAASRVNTQLIQGPSSILADLNELPTTLHLENSHRLPKKEQTPEITERNYDTLFNVAKSKVHISSCNNKPFCSFVQALPTLKNQFHSSKNVEVLRGSEGSFKRLFNAVSQSSPSVDMPISLQIQTSCSESKESVVCMSSLRTSTAHHLKYANGSISLDLNSAFFRTPDCTPDVDPSSGNGFIDTISAKQIRRSSFSSLDGETTRKSKRCRVIDINLPCDAATDDEPFTEVVPAEQDSKGLGQINLNKCIYEYGFATKSSSFCRNTYETNLEAPVSPEVEERPPPRGYSEENLPELTLEVSAGEGDGVDTLGERAVIAAEAIVSMSSNTFLFSETKDGQNSEVSDSRDLELFAGLVCSFYTELDNDVGTLRFSEMDDFEAMTLMLTETKSEQSLCRKYVEISSQTCSVSTTRQTRKGRTRRPKIKKDFQREILPSLVSLSRYEVTEDLQMIEGLMEATGTPWQLRTRRACRMGRKPRVIKQQTPPAAVSELNVEFVLTAVTLMSWGKDNKRPRRNRSPVSQATLMSRWLELTA